MGSGDDLSFQQAMNVIAQASTQQIVQAVKVFAYSEKIKRMKINKINLESPSKSDD